MNILLSILNAAVIVLSFWCLHGEIRHSTKLRWWALAGGCLAVLSACAVLVLIGWEGIDPRIITILHEGCGLQNINHLYGAGVHAGPNFFWITQLLDVPPVQRLQSIVCLNIALTLANSVIFFVLTRSILGSLPVAAILTAIFSTSFVTRVTAVSELPSAVLTLYFWMGIIAAATINRNLAQRLDAKERSPLHLFGAVLLLFMVTIVAALTRLEYAGFGIVALVTVILRLWAGEKHLDALQQNILNHVVKFCRNFSIRSLITILALLLGSSFVFSKATSFAAGFGFEWEAFLSGANPFELSFLNLPFFLFNDIPLTGILLFILGTIYMLRYWRRFCLLPVALIILYKIYYQASHQAFFEMIRYMTILNPLILFISIWGWKELERLSAKHNWNAGWRRLTLVFLIILLFVPPNNGNPLTSRQARAARYEGSRILIDRNLQREVQYLLNLTTRYPQSLLISRFTAATHGRDRGTLFHTVLFGSGVRAPIIIRQSDQPLSEIAQNANGDFSSVLFYHGLDCNLDHGPGCHDAAEQGTLLEEKVFANLPYNDPDERGGHTPEIRLQVYQILP